MLVGAITVVVWKEFIGLGLYEIIPGFALASLAIIGVSLADREPSQAVRATFEQVQAELSELHR